MEKKETDRAESFSDRLRRLAALTEGLGEGTSLYAYIGFLLHIFGEPEPLFTARYRPIVEAEAAKEGKRPFLSVVMRTQGRRPEMLREALLCLMGQTDDDFELLLIGHKLDEAGRAQLSCCMEELPSSLRERLRVFETERGNRTSPLNLGFAHARGAYAAVLDDDDLVFDDWVQRFHEAAQEAPGAVLHAYIVTQKWETQAGENGLLLRSAAAPGAECCSDFCYSRELAVNLCPLLGLAFPLEAFRRWGLLFDESLSTTEDWDYLMRLAFLFGVRDIPQPTGLYRLWLNAENSQTAHPAQEWETNYETIQRKFRQMPALFPAGSEKLERVDRYLPVLTPRRTLIKSRLRRLTPPPLWRAARRVYRALGGKSWLG